MIEKNEEWLEQFCQSAQKRLRKDWDLVIAICGTEGCGKSTLAIKIGQYMDPKFNLEASEVFSPDAKEVENTLLKKVPRFGVVILDEAVKLLYKMEFMSKTQHYIKKLYTVCREQNKATLLCIPRFSDLAKSFRDERVMYWIQVVERGHAVVFRPSWNMFSKDKWHIDDGNKIINKYISKVGLSVKVSDRVKILKRLPTFYTEFYFDDIDEDLKKRYKKMASEQKYDLDFNEEKDLYREIVKWLLVHMSLLGYTQDRLITISKGLLSKGTLDKLLKEAGVRKRDKKIKDAMAKALQQKEKSINISGVYSILGGGNGNGQKEETKEKEVRDDERKETETNLDENDSAYG